MPLLEALTTPWRLHNVDSSAIVEDWPEDRLPRAQLTFRVPWSLRAAFLTELKGGYLPSAAKLTEYTEPAIYTPKPDHFCLGISSVRGYGRWKRGVDGYDPYKWAIITADFGVPDFDIKTGTSWRQIDPSHPILYCKQRMRASAAYKILPKDKIKFSDSSKVVEQEISKPAAQSEITLEFPFVPFNMAELVSGYLGKINKNPMLKGDAGQVLFDAIDTTASGFVLTYLRRDSDWNTLVNDAGDDELVEFDITPAAPTPRRPFEQVDLLAMFTDPAT